MNDSRDLKQYRTPANLNARIKLHEKYSVNPQGFHEWVFLQMDIRKNMKILECGCGPGMLWRKNRMRIPKGCKIVLLDMSKGMLQEAESNIGEIEGTEFSYKQGDIQKFPFGEEVFDLVIANHMLYHVPDINNAIEETRRVLKHGGYFYASTFGHDHLKELDLLTRQYVVLDNERKSDRFTLENGLDFIAEVYQNVKTVRHEDALIITQAQDLIEYILSGSKAQEQLTGEKKQIFENKIKQFMEKTKEFRVRKDAGVFIANKV